MATSSHSVRLGSGKNALETTVTIPSPRLWTTWDRGTQPLYEASLQLVRSGSAKLGSSVTFGIRTVELRRSLNETRFFINGKPVYLRGTTYWPDLYLSNMDRARYERDIQAAIHAGINAFRVHVHTENPEFYAICDRLGVVVIQDNDLNWMFPTDQQFSARAVQHFGTLVKLLRNHPSVIAWIAMNEVFWGEGSGEGMVKGHTKSEAKALGAKLIAAARELDASRPVIENSGMPNDPASGDTHDYRGSLNGGGSTYFDIDTNSGDGLGSPPKLVTEFGVDVPPAMSSLLAVPEAAKRLRDVLPCVSQLHDYQYHLLKHYIEHYRMQKHSPNAGYFQFMWIDFSPQSFYGVYDYWGVPKTEGLGGGLRALQESNQPIGIFMEHSTEPRALYAVNDTATDLGNCIARWHVTTSNEVIMEDSQSVQLGPDSHRKIREFRFPVKAGQTYKVVLELLASDGRPWRTTFISTRFSYSRDPGGIRTGWMTNWVCDSGGQMKRNRNLRKRSGAETFTLQDGCARVVIALLRRLTRPAAASYIGLDRPARNSDRLCGPIVSRRSDARCVWEDCDRCERGALHVAQSSRDTGADCYLWRDRRIAPRPRSLGSP